MDHYQACSSKEKEYYEVGHKWVHSLNLHMAGTKSIVEDPKEVIESYVKENIATLAVPKPTNPRYRNKNIQAEKAKEPSEMVNLHR